MQRLTLLDTGRVPNIANPPKHISDRRAHRHLQRRPDQTRRHGHLFADHVSKDLIALWLGELVARETDGCIVIDGILVCSPQQTLGSEPADVADGDHLGSFGVADLFPEAGEAVAMDIGGQVVEERDGPEEGVCQVSASRFHGRDGREDVLLDGELGREVLDVRRIGVRSDRSTAVARGVDDVSDPCLRRGCH